MVAIARRIWNGAMVSTGWPHFIRLFLGMFVGLLGGAYAFVLLLDPYGIVPFSLPISRPIVSLFQRHEYPKIVRSGRFDSYIVGTSTSRLLDPHILDPLFNARFANLAMNSMSAWEQARMLTYVLDHAAPPKVVMIGLDRVWCDHEAPRTMPIIGDFPDWLYDDNPWNDYLHLLNEPTVELAARTLGTQIGLYRERIRSDGFGVFTPPEADYDARRAEQAIWHGPPRSLPFDRSPYLLSAAEREALQFPALPWLDATLGKLPASTLKVLAFMPVHVASQPEPGSRDAAVEAECKDRVVAIAARHGAEVIDWRIPSPITTVDENYWDNLHYRLPVAQKLARELGTAAVAHQPSQAGDYRILR